MEAGAVELEGGRRGPGRSARDDVERTRPEAYVAELLGTFFLVLFIVVILSVNSKLGLGYADFAVIGLVHAFVLMLLIHALGEASGAHFNPAVTVALTALRKIAPVDAAIYIGAQLVGATLAALLGRALLTDEGGSVSYGATTVSGLLSGRTLGGMVVELLGTFVLMWAIMALAVNPKGERHWAGFVIGTTLGFAVMAFGPLTGAGFNPARSLGPAIVSGNFDGVGRFVLVYVIAPIVGALLAASSYTALILRPQGVWRDGRIVEGIDEPNAGGTPGQRPVDTYD